MDDTVKIQWQRGGAVFMDNSYSFRHVWIFGQRQPCCSFRLSSLLLRNW